MKKKGWDEELAAWNLGWDSMKMQGEFYFDIRFRRLFFKSEKTG